ncbi:MAG: hypothetical protein ACP5PV_01585 [Methanothrix sp.]
MISLQPLLSARPDSPGARDCGNLAPGHVQAAPAGPGGGHSISAPGRPNIVAADAITDNCRRLGERKPPLTGSKKLLPNYVCGMNPLGGLQPGCRDCEEDN